MPSPPIDRPVRLGGEFVLGWPAFLVVEHRPDRLPVPVTCPLTDGTHVLAVLTDADLADRFVAGLAGTGRLYAVVPVPGPTVLADVILAAREVGWIAFDPPPLPAPLFVHPAAAVLAACQQAAPAVARERWRRDAGHPPGTTLPPPAVEVAADGLAVTIDSEDVAVLVLTGWPHELDAAGLVVSIDTPAGVFRRQPDGTYRRDPNRGAR